jgi:hypothetical protein
MKTFSLNLAFALYYVFKISPMVISGMAVYLGYRLFVLGVTGQASLSIESDTVSGQLLNAAPGLFFALGGIVTAMMMIVKGAGFELGPHGHVHARACMMK